MANSEVSGVVIERGDWKESAETIYLCFVQSVASTQIS
jgi:hypothetical protein